MIAGNPRRLLIGTSLFMAAVIGFNRYSFDLTLSSFGFTDPRPKRTILILGNSRTYAHDMPAMLQKIADSAKDDHQLDITVAAYGGASLESLDNDPEVAALLLQTWMR